jgi:uncharacterized protein YggE
MLIQRPDAPPSPPSLLVSGTAQVLATPDEVRVRLGVERQSPNAQAAQEQANKVAQEILGAIRKLGVSQNQIQTARLVLTPVYAPRSPDARDAPRIVAYNASNTVSVRLDNLSLTGAVIDGGLRAGANHLEGIQFGLRNDLPARQEALKQAVQEARTKAQAMADALNVNLVEVIEVSESGVSIFAAPQMAMADRMALATETPVSPGEIQVNANVTIRYRISAK